MDNWEDKVVVIAGVNAGPGQATSKYLARKGTIVVGLEHGENWDDDSQIISQVKSEDGIIFIIKCNLKKESEILNAFEWIEENAGGVDMLINNSAVMQLDKTRKSVININTRSLMCKGLCICAREATKSFKKRGEHGHIINIGRYDMINVSNGCCPTSYRKIKDRPSMSFLNMLYPKKSTKKRLFSQSIVYRKGLI